MHHHHGPHDHFHGDIRRYWVVAIITFFALLLEGIGGYYSGSLSLFSDALHLFVDLASVVLALIIEYWVKGGDGYRKNRVRGIGGIVSSVLLFVSIVPICWEAIERLVYQHSLEAKSMILFAVIGLVGNVVCLKLLHHSHDKHVTHVSLSAHLLSDLVQSVGVVVAGIVIWLTDWFIIDPLVTFAIALLLLRIGYQTFRRAKNSLQAPAALNSE